MSMSISCWRCATWPGMIAGTRAGRRSENFGSKRGRRSEGSGRLCRHHRRLVSHLLLLLRWIRPDRPNARRSTPLLCPQPSSRPHQPLQSRQEANALDRQLPIHGDSPFSGDVWPNGSASSSRQKSHAHPTE